MSHDAKSGKPMVSRRTALTAAAGIGVTVAAAGVTQIASAAQTEPPATVDGPIVVRVRDARSGQLDVFTGSGHVVVSDSDLADRLLRLAGHS